MHHVNSHREFTKSEKMAIHKLVVDHCANFDKTYGCLPLEEVCYMLHKTWTGTYCKYFANAVLPLNPELESSLMGIGVQPRKQCSICHTPFYPKSNIQRYCSARCAQLAQRENSRKRMVKMRQNRTMDVTKWNPENP